MKLKTPNRSGAERLWPASSLRGLGAPVQIAVVIATKDRPEMLSARALASVLAQTYRPDYLVIVDDSSPEIRPRNHDCVASLHIPDCQITYLENVRTEGASGAWNSALDLLFTAEEDPQRLFVAILDDDDAWAPTYLERCVAAALGQELDMVAADLRRHEAVGDAPRITESPRSLVADDFLVGNPGIQGSNLFVRLSVLLAAGGFDEALRSTTDRDLCIRIADLGTVRYGRLPLVLVEHFADPGRGRLSTRGSAAKLDGLTAFWRKYVGRMTVEQRRAFSDRAADLFDWHRPPEPVMPVASDSRKTTLVVGLAAHDGRPHELLDIATQLVGCRDESLVGLDVVVLGHGGHPDEARIISLATTMFRDAGIGCFRLTPEGQAEDRAELVDPPGQYEMLRAYCARVAETRTGTEVWLTDGRALKSASPSGKRVEDILQWLGAERSESACGAMLDASTHLGANAELDRWILRERVATAEHRVKRRFSLERIRVLGYGSEAVVFTDERTVYKCIDYWKTRMARSQLDFLREQVGRWADVPGLYPLHEVAGDGPWAVLTYDYEPSEPYQGGREAELVQLLNGCCAAGIVCNNVHPKNLVVTASGVKLVDYGSDIRPWSELGFEHMARRAFLVAKYAARSDLDLLMRRALTDPQLPELVGYSRFRADLVDHSGRVSYDRSAQRIDSQAPAHQPFSLYVGVITADPPMLRPLVRGLASLQTSASIKSVVALVLDNGSPRVELEEMIRDGWRAGLKVAVVSVPQQRRDAAVGAFGAAFPTRPHGQVGIAQARTMLQRYLGALLTQDQGSFGWVLDDDMRVDARARDYLPWLPAFREQGVDALIGAYEGSSPNPPLNGLRVHLVDLFHNLLWLKRLPSDAVLPDRSIENAELRARFPDYYYDLSRKHTGHLEMPHWLEPAVRGEIVAEARSRLLAGAAGILNGDPLTRPIIASMPSNPLMAARDSVNRGGCTFILNPRTLTDTPNTITRVQGREARRSDMIWAIVNRYYRRMTVKAVGFPVHHVGRVAGPPSLNIDKVQGELVGSTLYAGLTEFLRSTPHHELHFSSLETEEIGRLAGEHLDRRLRSLEQSFYRIAGLREAIRTVVSGGELDVLLVCLDRWFSRENFQRIRSGVRAHSNGDVQDFLASLPAVADDFASSTVDTDFIVAQLLAGPAGTQ